MAKNAILYIDLLGVQKMWVHGGAIAVHRRVEEFGGFVMNQLNYLSSDLHRDGEYTVILAGDSVAITCQDYEQAIGIGVHLFTQAFYHRDVQRPFWLRGAISKWTNQYMPINGVPITAKGLQVGTRQVSEYDFLQALALEKSGYKGMRLILDSSMLDNDGRDVQRMWSGFQRPLGIVTRLRECTYPEGRPYADVLWMANDESRYTHLRGIMQKRFKESTADPDELVQSAWTRAVFDQVESLLWLCRQDYSSMVEAKGLNSPGSDSISSMRSSIPTGGVDSVAHPTPATDDRENER